MAKGKKQKNVSVALITIVIIMVIFIILIASIGNKPLCGNNKCDNEETCTSCPQDCGPCPTTTKTTTKVLTTTKIPSTTTTISGCSSNSDCMWCGDNCIPSPNDIPCIALAPPEGYSCECVNRICTKVKVLNVTTTTMPDSCNDTDGGVKYDVQGTISGYFLGKPYSYTDYCNSDSLIEYYCLATHYWHVDYNCAYAGKKCVDGACV